jgi:hypothetical protein
LLRAGAQRVAVATYLLAPGVFADQIRERSLAAGASAVSAPLGAAPEVADVIVERYLQAASHDQVNGESRQSLTGGVPHCLTDASAAGGPKPGSGPCCSE